MTSTTTPSVPTARALLSLWNGIDAARIDEYDRWHTLEHVPERVWVPGFVSGTRYQSLRAHDTRYFTLYELEDLDCLASPAYQDLVDHPTPWSASMRPSFQDFLRKTGPLLASVGASTGSALAVMRAVWTGAAPAVDVNWAGCAQHLLMRGAPQLATRVRVQAAQPAGPQAMRNVDRAPQGAEVLFIVDTASVDSAPSLAGLLDAALSHVGMAAPDWREDGVYRLLSQVRHAEVRSDTRPAPRSDLQPTR